MQINWLGWPVRQFDFQVMRSLGGFDTLDWNRLHERLWDDKYPVRDAINSELRRRVKQARSPQP